MCVWVQIRTDSQKALDTWLCKVPFCFCVYERLYTTVVKFLRIRCWMFSSEICFILISSPRATEILKYKHSANCAVKFKSPAQLFYRFNWQVCSLFRSFQIGSSSLYKIKRIKDKSKHKITPQDPHCPHEMDKHDVFSFSLIYTISIRKHSHCLGETAKCFLFNYTMQPQSLLGKDFLFIYLTWWDTTKELDIILRKKILEGVAFICNVRKNVVVWFVFFKKRYLRTRWKCRK